MRPTSPRRHASRQLRQCAVALLTIAAALGPRSLHAQSASNGSVLVTPAAGSLVRVTLPPDLRGRRLRREAIVVAGTLDSMRLAWRNGDTASLSVAEMQRLELGMGAHRPIAASIGVGALVGGAGFSLLTYLTSEDDFLFSRGEVTAIAGLVGALGGAAIGGLVGASARSERWRTVYRAGDRTGVAIRPVLGRTRGLQVRVAF